MKVFVSKTHNAIEFIPLFNIDFRFIQKLDLRKCIQILYYIIYNVRFQLKNKNYKEFKKKKLQE